jgi:hypothetical protein
MSRVAAVNGREKQRALFGPPSDRGIFFSQSILSSALHPNFSNHLKHPVGFYFLWNKALTPNTYLLKGIIRLAAEPVQSGALNASPNKLTESCRLLGWLVGLGFWFAMSRD